MRGHVILLTMVLLLSPGCTYFDDYVEETTSEDNTETDALLGCTDPDAENYNSDATEDDGSCDYSCLLYTSDAADE